MNPNNVKKGDIEAARAHQSAMRIIIVNEWQLPSNQGSY